LGPSVFQHFYRQLRLGLEGHLMRHPRFSTSPLVSTPLLRQVKTPVQKGTAARGKVGQENTYLAILYLCPGYLTHPRRSHVLKSPKCGIMLCERQSIWSQSPHVDKHPQFSQQSKSRVAQKGTFKGHL
jgi:hypothetical protein